MAHIRIDDDFGKKALEEIRESMRPRVPMDGGGVVLGFSTSVGEGRIGGHLRAVPDREEWRFLPSDGYAPIVADLKALVNRAPGTVVEVYGHRYLVWGMWGESFRLYDPARVPDAVAGEIALAAPLPYTLTRLDGTPVESLEIGDGDVRDVFLNGHKVEMWATSIVPGVTFSARWVEGRVTVGRASLHDALRDLAARLPPTPEAGWVEATLTFVCRSTAVWAKDERFVDLCLVAKDTSDPVWVDLCGAYRSNRLNQGPVPEVAIERKGKDLTRWTVSGNEHLPVTGGGDHRTRLTLTPLSPAKQEPQGDPAPVKLEGSIARERLAAENRRQWMLVGSRGLNDGKFIEDPEERTAFLLKAIWEARAEGHAAQARATAALANVVGAALMIATLGPGEAPKDAPDHALVVAGFEQKWLDFNGVGR